MRANYLAAVIVAGVFTLGTCVVTAILIGKHIKHWNRPNIQRNICRIVMMAPVYGVESFFSLVFVDQSVYISALRDCYEAFVIYTFFNLMLDYLGGVAELEQLLSQRAFNMPVPLCMMRVRLDKHLVRRLKQLTLQYVLVKPVCAMTAIIANLTGNLGEGSYSPKHALLYITIVENISVCIALYALVAFYQAARKPLQRFRPLPKFILVKSVIFLTFWQGVLLGVLAYFGVLHDTDTFTIAELKYSLQNFAICLEMFLASIAHHHAFGYDDFRDANSSLKQPFVEHLKKLPTALSVKDVIQDTKETFGRNRVNKLEETIEIAERNRDGAV